MMLNASSLRLTEICLILDKFCCRTPHSDSSIAYFQHKYVVIHGTEQCSTTSVVFFSLFD